MKKARHKKILSLINEYNIDRQEVLLEYLQKEGSNVIHLSNPAEHIRCFQFFRYTLLLCHFLYQIFRHITNRSINFGKVFI